MVVVKSLECAADLGISKVNRAAKGSDLNRQPLTDAKMNCLPGNLLAKINKACCEFSLVHKKSGALSDPARNNNRTSLTRPGRSYFLRD
jgi:hypothetical protein